MSSSSVVPCREVFDENSQPSAEEISDYAQQLGIDLEHESHLLPLARDGLMQALPPPWKAYYDEKIQAHYYYNEETKCTQWEHPLDRVYRELVRRSRDASVQDDTYVSVQETKCTQWEHPLDRVYRELVRRSRDASVQDDTYVSVQETKCTQWEHPLDRVYRELVRRSRDASVQDDTYVSVQETKCTQWEHPLDRVYRELVRRSRDASVQDDTYVSVQETKCTQWEHPLDRVYRELVRRSRDASVQDDTYVSVQETKCTQWEHPLDRVYRELVRRSRDASVQDDTYVSVQELLTSEENTKHLSRVETRDSEEEALSTDSEEPEPRRRVLAGRPPLAPLTRTGDKKLSDTRISPLRRSVDSSFKAGTSREKVQMLERPKFFKQQSEIIDLKLLNHVLNSPEEESFNLFGKGERVLQMGLPLSGKGSLFLKGKKTDLPSPDTDKSLPLDSAKSEPPKGILREKIDVYHRKVESLSLGRPRQTISFEEDRKSVRFKLEHTTVEPTISPGSNSSSDHNDNQSSIISATPTNLSYPPHSNLSSNTTTNIPASSFQSNVPTSVPMSSSKGPIVLAPIVSRPPLPPRPQGSVEVLSPRESVKSLTGSDSLEGSTHTSPRRRVVRPPAADYIKQDLFQKNFHKIADLLRPGDDLLRPGDVDLGRGGEGEEMGEKEARPRRLKNFHKIADLLRPGDVDLGRGGEGEEIGEKEARPRSPMIPQVNKISINLMESIESETSIDSPDREFANLDLNDMDDSKDLLPDKINESKDKVSPKESQEKENSEINSHTHSSSQIKSPKPVDIPQINVPKFDFHVKPLLRSSESEDSKKTTPRDESRNNSRSESLDHKNIEPKVFSPNIKISPNPSIASEIRSPKFDVIERPPWSTFKPGLNKAVVSPQIKTSESNTNINKGLSSPRLDGVIISQGKSLNRGTDNVVVMYQFEKAQEENSFSKPLKSPADVIERNKLDERRRLDLVLQKELEEIRVENAIRERKSRAELLEEMRENEERFKEEKRIRLMEQAERHRRELEEALTEGEQKHQQILRQAESEREERRKREIERAERELQQKMTELRDEHARTLLEQQRELELDNERALSDLHNQLQASFQQEKSRLAESHRASIQRLRQQQDNTLAELRHDYRAEVDRLRAQHACHLEEVRRRRDPSLEHKYSTLKQKYTRLKHDVKSSIERRNKRRELSLATGSETDKSSHKANTSLDRCKELNAQPVSLPTQVTGSAPSHNDNSAASDPRANNNPPSVISPESSNTEGRRRATVVFKEPPRRSREREKQREKENTNSIVTTDFQDSSDATTADEKPRDTANGTGRRRCFTRLKSASTSRLNYSPKRSDGWSSPLEALRQQLRKLDDLDDQFPDLGSQPPYSLRYPFGEFDGIAAADVAEIEFVRHRALIEREGMRRCRSALRRRRRLLRDTESRDTAELEIALHRARALLGERSLRLRHIERALRALPGAEPAQEKNGGKKLLSHLFSRYQHEAATDSARALPGAEPQVLQ
ncbi:unnamed protein product [Plutella xylostella]|uniref:(diamondback moth) hypothetical protein n=1 Tax=Plutella xylostella TaxID=51655 RepID=A0A8S4DLZ5_PLUXY|nr:unnamed protein product [Plutella xylostella]